MAFASVAVAFGTTCLVSTGWALPADLAQTRCLITAITVLTIRTHSLGAISTTITDIAFTTTRHTIATTMARASIGAHLHLTSSSHESRSTEASSINTLSVRGTISGAALQRAIEAGPADLADTVRSNTVSVVGALVGTRTSGAIKSSVTSLAIA